MTNPTINQIAEEAIALAAKATPGPWDAPPWIDDANAGLINARGRVAMFYPINSRKHPHQCVANQEMTAHAGTHYARIARAVLDQAAEIERLRGALREIAEAVYPPSVVREHLPAGDGIGNDEVGQPGPWFGVRLPNGEERGWSRSRFEISVADVGIKLPSPNDLARLAAAALAAKHTREPGP